MDKKTMIMGAVAFAVGYHVGRYYNISIEKVNK